MADFSFLSDSDDDKRVEELLSQAIDHSVLEEIAAINCSGFTDSVLPTHLETRFSKLKSFPATQSKAPFVSNHKNSASISSFSSIIPPIESIKAQFGGKSESDHDDHDDNVIDLLQKEDLVGEKDLKPKSQSRFSVSPSKLSDSSRESAIFWPSKKGRDGELGLELKSRNGSFRSPSNSRCSSMESRSPPRRIGCFWCSPKRVSGKKNKENHIDGIDLDWGKDEELLSDLSTFSTKGQQKLWKKVMMEEEKINREAEKIVKWAKQASTRMEISGLDDELNENESTK